MHEHETQHDEVEIRSGLHAGEEAAPAPGSGMMGGGGATAAGGVMYGSGN